MYIFIWLKRSNLSKDVGVYKGLKKWSNLKRLMLVFNRVKSGII